MVEKSLKVKFTLLTVYSCVMYIQTNNTTKLIAYSHASSSVKLYLGTAALRAKSKCQHAHLHI